MRRPEFIAAQHGALAAFFISLLVCCSVPARLAGAIECLSAPKQSEPGWWSWREIDGRKCWYKKIGAVPSKLEFVWPEHAREAPPGEERAEQEPRSMQTTEPITATLPEVEIARGVGHAHRFEVAALAQMLGHVAQTALRPQP